MNINRCMLFIDQNHNRCRYTFRISIFFLHFIKKARGNILTRIHLKLFFFFSVFTRFGDFELFLSNHKKEKSVAIWER